ncbi:MAG TPA: Ig-like domain-containing protein [Candidatus Limnocylindria bacterium]
MSAGARSIRVARPAPPAEEPPRLAITRVATMLLGIAVVLSLTLPMAAFAAVRNWSLTRSPASVSGGTSVVSVTATNTGDDGGGEAVGCVLIVIPNASFSVSGVSIVAVGDSGDDWSAAFVVGPSDTTVALTSDSGGGNRLHQGEWVVADVTFTDTGLDGTFTWTGNAYNEEDCTDDFGMPRSVSVTIDGAPSNSAPTVSDDAAATVEDVPLSVGPPGVLGNDGDPDGDSISATLVGAPGHAASFVLRADGSYDYLPEADWSGTDTFTYQAGDGTLTSGTATVTIDVAPANDPPTANPDSYNGSEDLVLTVGAAAGVLANDSDIEGDSLSASLASTTSKGLLTLNVDGSFSYLPVLNFSGTDSFTYLVSDGTDTSGPITVTIDLNGVEDPPVATDDAYAVAEDGLLAPNPAAGVLANDSDPDGDGLTASLVSGPASAATFSLNANGSFSYRPVGDYHGPDSFSYRAFDGTGYSAAVTVTIDVTPGPDAPAAADDAYVVSEDGSLVAGAPGVLANDTDADGDPLTASIVTTTAHGSLSLAADGSFSYVPAGDHHGTDAFTYTASDGTTSTAPATVTLTVLPVNDPPQPAADSASLIAGASVLVDVVANDSDVDGDALSLVSVGTPSHGTAAIEGSRIRYSAAAGYIGTDTFRYRVGDGTASALGTVTVTIKQPPTTPTPVPTPLPAPPTPASSPAPIAPTSTPTPTSTPPPTPSASPSGDPTPTPAVPSSPPPASPSAAPAVALPTAGPLSLAPTGAAGGGVDVGFGTLASLLSFGWVIPGLTFFGVPGLLLVIAVLVQVSGAMAWLPAIRRNLGAFGFRRRNRRAAADIG